MFRPLLYRLVWSAAQILQLCLPVPAHQHIMGVCSDDSRERVSDYIQTELTFVLVGYVKVS